MFSTFAAPSQVPTASPFDPGAKQDLRTTIPSPFPSLVDTTSNTHSADNHLASSIVTSAPPSEVALGGGGTDSEIRAGRMRSTGAGESVGGRMRNDGKMLAASDGRTVMLLPR